MSLTVGFTRRAVVLAALILVAAVPSEGRAATAAAQGGVLTITAAPGEANSVMVASEAGRMVVGDGGSVLTPGAGCTSTGDPHRLDCGVDTGVQSVVAHLGDGDDSFWAIYLRVSVFGEAGDDRLVDATEDDRLPASGWIDDLHGGAGNDRLDAADGDDVLDGGEGDDYLDGAIGESPCGTNGADLLDGGPGTDLVSYAQCYNGATGTLDGEADDGVAGERDRIVAVENLEGGYGGDHFVGDGGPNVLDGGACGASSGCPGDVLDGAGGADELVGGGLISSDPDVLDGGQGPDRLVDRFGPGDVRGGPGDDLLVAPEYSGPGSERLAGGDGADQLDLSGFSHGVTITMNGLADDAVAGNADDVSADIETLTGTRFADTLRGGDGAQRIDGGAGADAIGGGAGRDTVDYSARTAPIAATLGRDADDGAPAERDDLSADLEVVLGGAGGDRLAGAGGDEQLQGGPGDDVLDGGPGADILSGGPGRDRADYGARTQSLAVDLDGAEGDDGAAGEHDSVLADVEDLAAGSGDDELSGNDAGNRLDGGRGDDVLRGLAGVDTVDYSSRTAAVAVDLADGLAADGEIDEYDAAGDDIENIIGGSGDDLLIGSDAANRIEAGAGTDLLDGGGGADDLRGGDGYDLASYLSRTAAVVVSIDAAPASGGALDGPVGARDRVAHDVEGLLGGAGDDRLTGDAGDNLLYGGRGADHLAGGAGGDAADYSDRDEGVVVALDGRPASGSASDGAPGARDSIAVDVEAIFGGAGDDTLTGNERPNLLDGADGDDELHSADEDVDLDACGNGTDTAFVDDYDAVDDSCERVNPLADTPRPTPTPTPTLTPTPTPAPSPAPRDTTAPKLVLAVPSRQTLRQALTRGLRASASCSEACTTRAQLALRARDAKRLRLGDGRKPVVVARATARRSGPLTLRFTARARRRMAPARSVTLTLTVEATDVAGNATSERRTVKLSSRPVTATRAAAATARRLNGLRARARRPAGLLGRAAPARPSGTGMRTAATPARVCDSHRVDARDPRNPARRPPCARLPLRLAPAR